MSDEKNPEQYKAKIEGQSRQLIQIMDQLLAGNSDVTVDLETDDPTMADLADRLSHLVQKWQTKQPQAIVSPDKVLPDQVSDQMPDTENTAAQRTGKKWRRYMEDDVEDDTWPLSPEWRPAAEEALTTHRTAVTRRNGRQNTAVPIKIGEELIGLMGFENEDDLPSDDELTAVADIAEQVGQALENQRLFDQTQQALAETATLFGASTQFNSAETVEDVLYTFISNIGQQDGLLNAIFWEPEFDESTTKPIGLHRHTVLELDDEAVLSPETYFSLEEYPGAQSWLDNPNAIVFLDDIQTAELTADDENFRRISQQMGVRAAAHLPLTLGARWVGLLTIQWSEPQQFTLNDERLYATLAAQTATSIDGILLLKSTQRRAEQLERLSQIEAALSQARTENDFVEVIGRNTVKDAGLVTLQYFDVDDEDNILHHTRIAGWLNGTLLPEDHPFLDKTLTLDDFPTVKAHHEQYPTEIFYLDNVEKYVASLDEKTRQNVREEAERVLAMGIFAVAVVPLRSGGYWQGSLSVSWSQEHHFTAAEKFFFERLRETMGGTIASRRAYLAQQDALSETERLYSASAGFNAAESVQDVLRVIVRNAAQGGNSNAVFYEVETEADSTMPTKLIIRNLWLPEQQKAILQLDAEYPVNYKALQDAWGSFPKQVILVSDTETDPRLVEGHQPELRDIYRHLKVRAIVYLPLFIGRRWVGAISIQWPQPKQFTERDEQLYQALSAQASTAVDGLFLLQSTRERAELLERLSRIEIALSQAQNENDIVGALGPELFTDQQGARLTLQYMMTDKDDNMLYYERVAGWSNGQLIEDDGTLHQPIYSEDLPGVMQQVQNNPTQIMYAEDVNQLPEKDRHMLTELGARTAAMVPLRSGGRWQGSVALMWPQKHTFTENEKFFLERIQEAVAGTVASRRAYLAQQEALSETERLYQASTAFNRAESADDVVDVIIDTLQDTEADTLALWEFETEEGQIKWAEKIANWRRDGQAPNLPVGSMFQVENYPFAKELFKSNQNVILAANPADHPLMKEDDNLLAILNQTDFTATAFLPLRIGTRWIGMITVQWKKERTFTEQDSRFFGAISAQVATTLDSIHLLESTRERASQLSLLTNIEARLSQAITEGDIISTLVDAFPETSISLLYIQTNDFDRPETMWTTAVTVDGQILGGEQIEDTEIIVSDLSLSELWINNPHQLTHISDLSTDPGIDEKMLESAKVFNYQAITVLPLVSSGKWQGIINLMWPVPHILSDGETFVLRNLMEPLAAVVASRRAQLAQQEARRETETLYRVSRRINEAGGDMAEIASALGEIYPDSPIDRIIIVLLNYNNQNEATSMMVAATWSSGQGPEPTPLGTRYPRAVFAGISYLLNIEPEFISDTQKDDRIDDNSSQVLIEQQIRSLGVLPLWTGARQLGAILLEAETTYEFPEVEKRAYMSLAPQVAVAVQNKLLLEDAEDRARREQILREVTAKVRSGTDVDSVMRTAAAEIGRVLGRKAFVYLNTPD